MFENGTFAVLGPDGKQVQCDVLFTYDCEDNGRSYVVFTTGEGAQQQLFANRYAAREDGQPALFPLENEQEYQIIKHCFEELKAKLADGLVVVCRRHNAKDSEGKTYPYLMELYQYIEQNADLCHVLLGKNGDIAFTDRICHILRDEFLYDFLAYYYPNDPAMLDYFCSFIVSGNMSLALTWIAGGMKQTAEEMAVLAGEIIMHGVKVLETKA